MISTRLTRLQSLLHAELIGDDCDIASVSTDSRQIDEKGLFVALIGERFDGHDFTELAKQNGAQALLLSTPVATDLPQLIVKDTKQALGTLGAWVKEEAKVKTIALTGSCGKTTVKEMLASILASQAKTLFTAGNFNNDIGVPLTLLRLSPLDEFAVIELGANHVGEISYTTELVKPDVALVTNLAAAHLEGFGSLAGVTKAKGEIFEGLNETGIAIINVDSWGEEAWTQVLANKSVVTVSEKDNSANFFIENVHAITQGCYAFSLRYEKEKHIDIALSLPGRHNVMNAALAAVAALQFSLSEQKIIDGLANVSPVKGRGAISFPRPGLRLIDDSYNASLAAMIAAVDLLDGFDGEKVIVLADMAEMGEHSAKVHEDVAEHVSRSSIQTVMTYGPASKVISDRSQGRHFDNKDALIAHVVELMKTKQEVSVLVKGANGMKMADVVKAIEESSQC